jgi:hypothetical protein
VCFEQRMGIAGMDCISSQDFFHEIRHMSVAIRNRPLATSLDRRARNLCERPRKIIARRV